MWGTIRPEGEWGHRMQIGHNKWELYNVEYGDREKGNFGSIKYGNEGERRGAQTRRVTDYCRLSWPSWRDLLGPVCLFTAITAGQG